jgi:hypothetical protein
MSIQFVFFIVFVGSRADN